MMRAGYLEELSVLGNTPKNQKFKGAFNIFESIADSNPQAQESYDLRPSSGSVGIFDEEKRLARAKIAL
ncbi:hypothetical protein V9T40_011369 [Parthenolecanium corni]|uniref:Uncharacterized protein n=1 Tax=Parthenolecanium corni TaxID=536013 RepID=A0AAN9T5C7_9HEMI